MNCLPAFLPLKNRYYVMRHGHSLANELGIIVSRAENGISAYGLSPLGQSQVNGAIRADIPVDDKTLIISSDFKRARETADRVHDLLKSKTPVRFDPRLRERDFGNYELSTAKNYERVWLEDKSSADNCLEGVESPNQVMRRVTGLVSELESEFSGASLLLVSHGDTLQILQTAFQQQEASSHRSQPHLETAEIRLLQMNSRQSAILAKAGD